MGYKSLIDGHDCTAHHYLAELVISREAKKQGTTLPPKFWNLDSWKKKYKLQIIAAHSLLKIFDMQDILNGLRCKEGNWIYSLQYRGLVDIIQNEKNKQAAAVKPKLTVPTDIENKNEAITTVKPKIQKQENLLEKLEQVDVIQRYNF